MKKSYKNFICDALCGEISHGGNSQKKYKPRPARLRFIFKLAKYAGRAITG